MSRGSGDKGKTRSRVEAVKAEMERLTGATFEVGQPAKESKPYGEKFKWYLRSPYVDQVEKMYHANAAWEDTDGWLHIRTMELGNYLQWVERDYGEQGASKAMTTDFNFMRGADRERLAKLFPLVESRIGEYERIAAMASGHSNLTTFISSDARAENISFYLEAKLSAEGLSSRAEIESVGRALVGLKKATIEIDKYETGWMHHHGST